MTRRLTNPLVDRRVAMADANPEAYEASVRQKYGHSLANLEALLKIVSRLSTDPGSTVRTEDINVLQRCYPDVPRSELQMIAGQINSHPWSQRSDLAIAALQGGTDAYHADPSGFQARHKELKALTDNFVTADVVATINKRSDVEVREPWRPEPGSVRDLINQQVYGKAHRMKEFIRSDDEAAQMVKDKLADKMELANNRLLANEVGIAPMSLRDTVSNAYDTHEAADVAVSEGWIKDDRDE